MAIDQPALSDIASIYLPQDVEKRGRKARGAVVTIGAIIILADGSKCTVAGFDTDGRPLCHPTE